MFVGRLEERKGIHYLIDAIPQIVKSFKNVRFIIIGDDTKTAEGMTSVLEELKDKVAANGSAAHIEWINRVVLESLPSYYRSADVCVVPSVYDNSPYTCLEAMACGRAVVGTSAGGTREYIVHNESGVIVPPRDADALAFAILDLLNDDKRRVKMANEARSRVLNHFQRKEIARQTVELYDEAIRTFAKRAEFKMYRRDQSLLYRDVDEFLTAWDQSIYELLYLDPVFRTVHYFNLIRLRPRLAAIKALRLGIARAFGKKANKWKLVKWLDATIERKHKSAEELHMVPTQKKKQLAAAKAEKS